MEIPHRDKEEPPEVCDILFANVFPIPAHVAGLLRQSFEAESTVGDFLEVAPRTISEVSLGMNIEVGFVANTALLLYCSVCVLLQKIIKDQEPRRKKITSQKIKEVLFHSPIVLLPSDQGVGVQNKTVNELLGNQALDRGANTIVWREVSVPCSHPLLSSYVVCLSGCAVQTPHCGGEASQHGRGVRAVLAEETLRPGWQNDQWFHRGDRLPCLF